DQEAHRGPGAQRRDRLRDQPAIGHRPCPLSHRLRVAALFAQLTETSSPHADLACWLSEEQSACQPENKSDLVNPTPVPLAVIRLHGKLFSPFCRTRYLWLFCCGF